MYTGRFFIERRGFEFELLVTGDVTEYDEEPDVGIYGYVEAVVEKIEVLRARKRPKNIEATRIQLTAKEYQDAEEVLVEGYRAYVENSLMEKAADRYYDRRYG